MTDTAEAAEQTTKPKEAVVTEEAVIDRLSGVLSGDAPPEPTEETTSQEASQTEEPAPEQDATSEESAKEAPKIEDVLPDNLQALAEEIGLEADEFAQYLKVPVKVNGETSTVTLEEVIKGYQNEGSLTQRSQEFAERQKTFEAQSQQAQSNLAAQIDQVGQVMTQLQSNSDIRTDAQLLEIMKKDADEGTNEYDLVKAKSDAQKEALILGMQITQQHQQQVIERGKNELAQYQNDQRNLLYEKESDLADTKHLEQFVKELVPFLKTMGFAEEELTQLANTYDHRFMRIARRAMKYDAFQKGKVKVKKLQSLPKVTKPGQAVRRTSGDDLTTARNRLKSMKGRSKAQQEQAAVDFVSLILKK